MGSGEVYEPRGGMKIGRYELRKKLAAGGMAELYLARVTGVGGFSKDVVLKRILPQLAESEQFFRMFLDEARIAATLAHPNIVQVHDAGETDGQYYIAMEYLDGADVATIRRHLEHRDEHINLDQVVFILSGVCAGLHYAHEKKDDDGSPLGIVHRDVTPQNMFVTRDGGVKLVDFGIAKAENRLSRTTYGTLKGKLAYMAPEQCEGHDVDRRGDIYSLGIVLYELSTGVNPHRAGAEYAMMKEIVEGTIAAPSSLVANYPRALEAIVMKAVAKAPDDRYQTARQMQLALEDYIRSAQLRVSPLSLSDYVLPLLDEIRIEQDSRAERFADEIDAYEDYLASKAPTVGKPRQRGAALAADAAAANASIDGLLEELRAQDGDGAAAAELSPRVERPARVANIEPPIAPIALTNVNVRTGNKVVGLVIGTVVGLGALIGYLALTGKLNFASAANDDDSAPAVRERALPERGAVAAASTPTGAAVWRYLGRTPVERVLVNSEQEHHFRLESDGYLTKALTIAREDWRGEGANKQASTTVSLAQRTRVRKRKRKSVRWSAAEGSKDSREEKAPSKADAQAPKGMLTIESQPSGVGVWMLVGRTPTRVEGASTRSGVELRFDSSGYQTQFIEVTERDFNEAGEATVSATLPRR